jgi:hypothetical protein
LRNGRGDQATAKAAIKRNGCPDPKPESIFNFVIPEPYILRNTLTAIIIMRVRRKLIDAE